MVCKTETVSSGYNRLANGVWATAILAICAGESRASGVESPTIPQENEVLQTVLAAVQDETQHIDEIALYLLLRRVDQGISGQGRDAFTEVTWSSLVSRPAEFRGKWVRVACRFVEARHAQLDNPQLWTKPIFTVMGVEEASGEPVSMVATIGPGYQRNDPVWLEGQFFKVRVDVPRDQGDENESKQLLIPVLVGREVRARNAFVGSGPASGREILGWSVGVVGVLLVAWLMARSRSGRRPMQQKVLDDEIHGADAFEPIDLERLERDQSGEDGEGG